MVWPVIALKTFGVTHAKDKCLPVMALQSHSKRYT